MAKVEIIAKLKQKNDADFKIADAKEGNDDEEKEAKQHLLVDLNVLSGVNHAMLNSSKIEGNSVSSENKAATVVDQRKYNTLLWEQAVERWTKARWTVASLESEDCPLQITRNDNILLKFRRRFESTDKATSLHIHCQRRILPPKFTLSSSTIIPFQAL